jgi:hypothetical protein
VALDTGPVLKTTFDFVYIYGYQYHDLMIER